MRCKQFTYICSVNNDKQTNKQMEIMKDIISNVLLGVLIIGCIGMAITLLRGIWNGGIDKF